MKKLLIITTSKYPNGDAGSIRQHIFAKMFTELNYNVEVIGMGNSTNYKQQVYDGIPYRSFRNKNDSLIMRIFNLVSYKSKLNKYLNENTDVTDILVISVPPSVISYLKKNINPKIKLYHDSVEWYSKDQFKLGYLSPSYQINNLYNKKWIDKKFKVISISKYLEENFKSRGVETIRLPILLDVQSMNNNNHTSNEPKIKIIYAGSIGNNKDYLLEFLTSIDLLSLEYKSKIEFNILGINKIDLVKNFKLDAEFFVRNENVINALGRVSRNEVINYLDNADFSILFRNPNQRYAKAGFPTKVVESLSTKTAVILNWSSDLNEYLTNYKDCLVVEKLQVSLIVAKLEEIVKMSREEIEILKSNARCTAEKNFDYKNYIFKLNEFMER